ncbi:efflux RND transporter periplasmic adaptor subunit [Ramlibacter tataouinensis]|uniref:efflux RND transporter periplasmic adaptor subunit n=1 Tax=Ramlibacter tataouinensis TaxID=94132 RepID=UPI0022F38899|nr:efflux RND transporter periplasmic adaptor subunit [Ramlibacter tataouinensis]WBY03781.1 efflux RND transporter periplasmic adaptor subunit [Ramlibacter tataouinensis]
MSKTLTPLRGALAALLLAQGALALAQPAASAPPAASAASALAADGPAGAPAVPPAAAPAPRPAAGDSGAVRALIVADQEATLSSQFAGRITAMPKQVGDVFAAGELLAGFDCQERQATVKAAQAEVLGARETHLAKLKLQSLGAVSDLDVTLAAATAEKAKSQLALAQAQEKYCFVHAPYAGKVVRVRAKAFESVQLGQPLLEIVNLASLRAQLFVPSSWVRWMKPGKAFTLVVDETGQTYTARVTKISGRIDGASQTVEVLARFDKLPANLLPGMIGKASFPEAR